MRDQLTTILIRTSDIVDASLRRAFASSVVRTLRVSFTIKDGRVSHIRESESDHPGRQAGEYRSSEPLDKRIAGILTDCGRVLRQKLTHPLLYGGIVLTLEIEGGDCKIVSCESEQVHHEREGV